MVFRKEKSKIMAKLNWKIWVLIFAVLGSLLSIVPMDFTKGLEIDSVEQNSTALDQGLKQGQIITHIDGQQVISIEKYNEIINLKFPSQEKQKLTLTTKSGEVILFDNNAPEISVKNIEKTRVKTGLDLSGGARALVVAEGHELTISELNDLIDITNERLNVYGLKDVIVKPQSDLFGKNKMLIEIAGSTPKELENLIAQQGKFEAKIGNKTVFIGGEKDITYIARSGEQAGIYDCGTYNEGFACQFRFGITISPEAAKKFSAITSELELDPENPNSLSQKIDLYLDDELYSSLSISKDLKGSETTQISISGSEEGSTQQEALKNTQDEMNQLQTVLKTGSLPFKLEIEKLDTISPLLGKKFIKTILITGLAVIFAVGLIVLLRYKKFKLSFAVLLTSLSEVMIILGISALFKVNLDLPAIAGIIAAIGTGVDSQIIILDESQMSQILSLKQRIKNALFIILGTYFTTLFALSPLYWAGGGLLKGFVVTTIIGISAGVLITRPAFSEIVKRILRD
jgi:preprotein translocase subunit SecD